MTDAALLASTPVFLRLSTITDHFMGGRRTRGPTTFRKIPHT